MFHTFQNLDSNIINLTDHPRLGIASDTYNNERYTAMSFESNDKITTKIFKNYNIEENLLETKCIFTWDSDGLALNNIFDLSLMCYQFYNITKPKLPEVLKKYTECLYNDDQIQKLRHVVKNDDLIPYYIWTSNLCDKSAAYLQLGQNLYPQFNEKDKQFYHHLLSGKKALKIIRENQIVINESYLSGYLKKASDKYLRMGKQILKRIKNKKIIQFLDTTGTVTGRLVGSGGLNLQTLPKGAGLKRCITSRFKNGKILVADWNAMEFRIALAEAEHIDLSKTDIHIRTAQQIFQKESISPAEREQAKVINFSIIYGGFTNKNAKVIEKLYPTLNNKVQNVTKEAKRTKKQVNIFGRKRLFAEDTFFQTKSFNNLIQGSAADICLRALYLIQDKIEKQQLESKIILAVHDSIVFDCKENEINILLKIIQDIMTDEALPSLYKKRLLFSVAVESGNNYEDLELLATIYKDEIQ